MGGRTRTISVLRIEQLQGSALLSLIQNRPRLKPTTTVVVTGCLRSLRLNQDLLFDGNPCVSHHKRVRARQGGGVSR
jgi:hypothetical protein